MSEVPQAVIKEIKLRPDDTLTILFESGHIVELEDKGGMGSRDVVTDSDLDSLNGMVLVSFEVQDPILGVADEDTDRTDRQNVILKCEGGAEIMVTATNQHDGYYSRFKVYAHLFDARRCHIRELDLGAPFDLSGVSSVCL